MFSYDSKILIRAIYSQSNVIFMHLSLFILFLNYNFVASTDFMYVCTVCSVG